MPSLVSTDWFDDIHYNSCNMTCDQFYDCDIHCDTTAGTTPSPTTPTTPSPTSPTQGTSIWEQIAENGEIIAGTVVVGGITYVAVEYVMPWFNQIQWTDLATTTTPTTTTTSLSSAMEITPLSYLYNDCAVGNNKQQFVIRNAPANAQFSFRA